MIRTLVVGPSDRELFRGLSINLANRELPLDTRFVMGRPSLGNAIADWRPHVILSFLAEGSRCGLENYPWEIRRRWVNYPFGFTTREHAIGAILAMYTRVITDVGARPQKLVSVITPTYNTGSLILRAYDSLKGQRYREWEWVLYDDSTDPETIDILQSLARQDCRVKVFRGGAHSGVIGLVKRKAFALAEGDVLVELDHDDELTDDCLELLVDGFEAHPECGFAYTECAEVQPDGSPVKYGDTFAFGFGSYRPFPHMYRGKPYMVTNYPSINLKTLSHIVGVPNHVRAWTKDAYWAAGGHNPDVFVCDDYELLLRTFLTTRMLHIRHLGYIQHRLGGGSNTHQIRNAEIQRQVAIFSRAYASAVENRAREIVGAGFIPEANQQLNFEFYRDESVSGKTGTHG